MQPITYAEAKTMPVAGSFSFSDGISRATVLVRYATRERNIFAANCVEFVNEGHFRVDVFTI